MIAQEQFINDLKELLETKADITLDTDLLDIDEWDSFSSVAFLEMIKSKYGVAAEPFSVAEAVLVEDLYKIVETN